MMATNISRTLEQLEGIYWQEPGYDSKLVRETYLLRKKPLKDFTVEDLRVMIGQNIGLKYLVPIAVETLEDNLLAEGNYYEGDLLKAVLSSEESYWKKNKEWWRKLVNVYKRQENLISQIGYPDVERKIQEAFKNYEQIN